MRSLKVLSTLFTIIFALAGTVNGAEFLGKQTGTTTITAGNTVATVTITSVDMSKSFLVFSSTSDNASPTDYQVGGEITDPTTLTFERTGNGGSISISWQVFEFESGVFVQHGSSTNVARNVNVDVAINCIDLSKSFVVASGRKSGTTLGSDDSFTADLTAPTNLQLFIDGAAGADYEEIYWQVIEYAAANVTKVTASLTGTSTTSTIAPALTNLTKAFVVSNHTISGNIFPDDLPRTELTNTTTVTYTRNGSGETLNFVTYVVELTDQSTVTRGVQAFGSGSTSQSVPITASTSSGYIGSGNFGRQGSSTLAAPDNTGHAWFTYEVTSPTNLNIQRAIGTGSSATAPWQIVTFEDTDNGLQTSTFYSRASGDWESAASWSYTPDGSSGAVPTGVYPRRTNNVVIQNGHTIAVDAVTDNNPCSQSPNGLGLGNVGAFTGSGDQMFYHTGDILIANGGTLTSSEEVMIEGYTLVENGGTFTVTEDIINLGYFEIAPTANFNNTDDLILSGNSITIIDNLSFGADDIYIDHTNATLCGDGVMNLGNGGADPTIQFFNGGTLNQVCSTFTVTCTSNCGAFPITPTGNFISGNVGPGGVGNLNNNKLWVRAHDLGLANGAEVTMWGDVSGNGLSADNTSGATQFQRPLFATNSVNGFASVSFDGGDVLSLGTAPLDLIPQTDSWSLFSTFNVGGGNTGTIIGKRNGNDEQWQYYVDVNFNAFAGGLQSLGSEAGTGAWKIGTSTTSTSSVDSWVNEVADIAGGSVGAVTSTSDVTIGARRNGSGTGALFGLTGNITEIAMYNVEVNAAQRIIIDNYLAAKYEITISNDFYAMDTPGNGDFDFEVAGVGQASDGSNHRDAKGTGVVRMWNPNGLANGEFLLWGHDNVALTSSTTAGVGAPIEERLSRTWRVSETGDVGNVRISFDFSSIGGSPLGSNLRLLIDRDGDGFGDNDVTPIVGTVSAGIAVFSNVNFQNGDRFTLGNTDASVPLPIELVEFNATPTQIDVVVKWTTASELNNDYFTVQRSDNAEIWEDIAKIEGAGTVSVKKSYQAVDPQPYLGESYYRLKQTDFDGAISFSHIERVSFNGSSGLVVHPNPSSGVFNLGGTSENTQVRIFNTIGQPIFPVINRSADDFVIDMQVFPQGVYIIQVSDGQSLRSVRIIKR